MSNSMISNDLPWPNDRSTLPLEQSVAAFMRYFIAYINPILHRTRYGGRIYSELEIIVCMGLDSCRSDAPGRHQPRPQHRESNDDVGHTPAEGPCA